jgi:tetratricopeptide (TPR) repeat protein
MHPSLESRRSVVSVAIAAFVLLHVANGHAVEPTTHSHELAVLNETLEAQRDRIATGDPSWLDLDAFASTYLQRAKLTGDYEDYVAAEALLDDAFALAPVGSGPFLTRASLNATLHRLDRVEADLAAVEKRILLDTNTRSAVVSLRAGVRLQRGDLEGALTGLAEALALHRTPSGIAQLAVGHLKAGDIAVADSLLHVAATSYHGALAHPVAWCHLQLGLMDLAADRLADAMAHYRDADAILSGWWLIEEHMAEVLTLEGATEESVPMYEDLVARTGNPEFMDALAKIHRDAGNLDAAHEWARRAETIYERRLAMFPEATGGHALEHYLEFGSDPTFTVDLATRNFAMRPNDEARELLDRARELALR